MINIEKDTIVLPIRQVPSYRVHHSAQRGNLRKVLMSMFAGIGDQICAEPTLRYAINCRKKGEIDRIALASSVPSLYAHLDFDEFITDSYSEDEWLVFDTIPRGQGLAYEHISHGLTNCVDASSLYAFRMMLPVKDKEIQISSKRPIDHVADLFKKRTIVVHAGKHWPSKTFPKWWWDSVLEEIKSQDINPILIGANVDGNRTTVDVDRLGCIDLRGKTDLGELAWICQRASVLLTNDSAPLHFAASSDPKDLDNTGRAHSGFIASCKHPDYISHWRKGQWAWRETNLSLGGIWDTMHFLPNKYENVTVDNVDQKLVESWLPLPENYAKWAIDRLSDV